MQIPSKNLQKSKEFNNFVFLNYEPDYLHVTKNALFQAVRRTGTALIVPQTSEIRLDLSHAWHRL